MKKSLLLLLLITSIFACEELPESSLKKTAFIPKPQHISDSLGYFSINKKTKIFIPAGSAELDTLATQFTQTLENITGNTYIPGRKGRQALRNTIVLCLDTTFSKNNEAYRFEIEERFLILRGKSPEGVYRGLQTFSQLVSLPETDVLKREAEVLIPTGIISDFPSYEYRGAMLDVARHFISVDQVKQYIDRLAIYKINHLHLHLSDDQGWRIEIKSWPKLTEIGGSTEVGGGESGFFTQEDYSELVRYAASEYITIVPEIDMPGHTNAALASYAELNCDGKATKLYTGMRVGFSTLCVDKELTYTFVDDVVREICALTPGPYFHIGGDESHVTPMKDYIFFVNKVRKIVRAHGKQMIGWEEIASADIDENDIAQNWRSSKHIAEANEKGASIILSPAKHCYLDMKYSSSDSLGLTWAGNIEVDQAYNWSPMELKGIDSTSNILGVESPLWAETIENIDDIDYLAFPRIIGHAEIGWSNGADLSWEDYKQRLKIHGAMLDEMGVGYYRSKMVWDTPAY